MTIRLHDPKEKLDSKKSAQWAQVKIPRGALSLDRQAFVDSYIVPALANMPMLKP